jgi:hypothetical protein
MRVDVDSSGLGALDAKLERLAEGLQERLQKAAKQGAERITAAAQGNVYQNGLKFEDGMIRDSLQPVVSVEPDKVQVGVETQLDVAVYHELGTGPVGTAAGYPGEEYLDQPVARRSTGWTLFSEDAADQRAAADPDGKNSGFVYTEGVAPKAFMHNALMQNKEAVAKMMQRAAMEGME